VANTTDAVLTGARHSSVYYQITSAPFSSTSGTVLREHWPVSATPQARLGVTMTTHCANPACGTRFQYFRSGKVFLIDYKSVCTPLKRPTYGVLWLCGTVRSSCACRLVPRETSFLSSLSQPARRPRRFTAAASRQVTEEAVHRGGQFFAFCEYANELSF